MANTSLARVSLTNAWARRAQDVALRLAFYRAIGALIAVFTMGFTHSLSAQDYGTEVRERLKDVVTWDELCEIEDCSQFPDGYVTWAIGTELYSFPLFDTLSSKVGRTAYGLRSGRFEEINSNGDVTRSFGYSDRLRMSYCCGQLLEFFDLMDDFPALGDDPDVRWMPSVPVDLKTDGVRHRLETYLRQASIDNAERRLSAK